jgi:hypothetical protein
MLGKILLTLTALALIVLTPMADYSDTHIFNPRWPPHAKLFFFHPPLPISSTNHPKCIPRFHNGQTITLSVTLGLATLFLTHRPDLPAAAGALRRESARMAAFTGSVYWFAGLAAYFFPGSDGVDPEFGGPGFPQGKLFAAFGVMAVVGGLLEGR